MKRRLARILVSPEFIGAMAFPGKKTITTESELPADAEFNDSYWDNEKRAWYVVFSHSSFKELYPGDTIPILKCPVLHLELKDQV